MPKTMLTARKHVPRRVRERLGIGNYRRIAQKAGLTHQHVARVLKGQRSCSISVLERIAEAAGVTLAQVHLFIHNYTQKERWFANTRITRREKLAGITPGQIKTAKLIARAYATTPMGHACQPEE